MLTDSEMLGFLLLCVCLMFGLFSYFQFRVSGWFLPPKKKPETPIDHQSPIPGEGHTKREASGTDYEVFLSFRGPDSRQGLVSVLYDYMTSAGIRVFKDDDELEVGDRIADILAAIRNSKICVPIFSTTFAASVWCLCEVEEMVQLGKKITIMPIFYKVTPDDVKLRTELFKKELKKHEKKHGREQVKKWGDALREIGRIKGVEVERTGFAKFSRSFAGKLQNRLQVKTKYLPEDLLIRRDDQEQKFERLLDVDANDVRMVGIHGMGGIGKTTLAKVFFNRLSNRFDCSSFLENIQDLKHTTRPDQLLWQLLEDLDPRLRYLQRNDPTTMLAKNFRRRSVLIVLDDIKERSEIEFIDRMLDSFGSGSRIIVTTRDKRVFRREALLLEMHEMRHDQALQLFSRHAFRGESPPSDYQSLSNQVISLTGGIPLALEVIGSLLYQKEIEEWKRKIERLTKIPHIKVREKLKISVDELEYDQRQIFLDIACFFINMEKTTAVYMWEACGFYPDDGIEVLIDMSLLKITEENKFQMHGLIRDLGRDLVREECRRDPAERSRIWSSGEAREVLERKQGKEKVEGIFLEEAYDGNLTNEEFSSFRNLRLLKLVNAKLAGDFENPLPKLKWFSWHQCPSDFTATNFSLKGLIVLDLSQSSISENWAGWILIQKAKELKVLDLTGCFNLRSTPDLSRNTSLERLILRGCHNLAKIHCSIKKLKRLRHLNLEGCFSLEGLPEEIGSLVYLEEILVEGNGNAFRLPESMGKLRALSMLKLIRVGITRVPDITGGLVNLTKLSLRKCSGLQELPDAIGNLKSLFELDLSYSDVRVLPHSVGRLTNLRHLYIKSTGIEELPDAIGDLKSLVRLDASYSKVSSLPDSLGRLDKLEHLYLRATKIKELPDALGDMESLLKLCLAQTNVRQLPSSVGRLVNLQKLELWSTELEGLPETLGGLTSLVQLNLLGTKLSSLPEGLRCLKLLKSLNISSSELMVLPDFVGELLNLECLNLFESKIRMLPGSVGMLTKLKHLVFTGCSSLIEIPRELGKRSSLASLDWSASCLAELLPVIGQLSSLVDIRLTLCGEGSSSAYREIWESALKEIDDKLPAKVKLTILSKGLECIPPLPSRSSELGLFDVSRDTRLPDFSNLKNLERIWFANCTHNDGMESLRQLPKLEDITLVSCSSELIGFCCQLENCRRLFIYGEVRSADLRSPETALHFPRSSIHLSYLMMLDCKLLTEICSLGSVAAMKSFYIRDCPSLETVGNFSELTRLRGLTVRRCPKLRELEGLDRLFLRFLRIEECGSLRNFNELKKRCKSGYFDGVRVNNNNAKGRRGNRRSNPHWA